MYINFNALIVTIIAHVYYNHNIGPTIKHDYKAVLPIS